MDAYPLQATTTYSLTDPNVCSAWQSLRENLLSHLVLQEPIWETGSTPHSGLLRQDCGSNLRREMFIRYIYIYCFMSWARALIHIDWGNSPSTNCKINVKLEARNVFRMSWVYIDRPLQSSGPTAQRSALFRKVVPKGHGISNLSTVAPRKGSLGAHFTGTQEPGPSRTSQKKKFKSP